MSAVESFIARWKSSGDSEEANYAPFLSELCDLIGVERPDPASEWKTERRHWSSEEQEGGSSTGPALHVIPTAG